MGEIKLYVETGRLFFIENEDRNGPAMSISLADRGRLRQAINRMSSDGDEELETGEFTRIEAHNTNIVALFKVEQDADDYVLANANVQKVIEASADGFDFKVITV